MNDFDALVRSLNPVLYLNHTTGDIRTRDSYGRTVVPGGTAQWGLAKSRRGFYPGGSVGTGALTIVDGGVTPELGIANGTLFAAGPLGFIGDAISRRIFSKTGGWLEFDFQYTNAVLAMQGTAGVSSIASATPAKRGFAVSFISGGALAFYRDGALLGAGAGAITVTPGTGNLSIWNMAAVARPVTTPGQVALIFNTVLTSEQISALDEAFARIPGVGVTQKIHAVSANLRPAGIECTEMFVGQIGSDGKIAGLKGVSVGTITQPIGTKKSKCCLNPAMVGNGGYIQATNPGSLISATQGAIEFVATPRADCPNGAYLVDSNANIRTRIQYAAAGYWYISKGNPIVTVSGIANSARVGRPSHGILTWWTDGGVQYVEFFIDGVLQQARTTFLDSTACGAIVLLSRSGTPFRGSVPFIRPYNQRITAAQARALYVEASRAGMVQDERFGYPVSLANVTAGKVGPWTRGSGTWQWQDDGSKRKLVTIGSGYAWRNGFGDGSAFGAWYFKAKKITGTYHQTMMIASINKEYTDAAQNGYMLQFRPTDNNLILYRVTAGVAPVAPIIGGAGYIANDIEYEIFLTRRYDGLLTLYIRGGAYTTWTTVGSGTDATHTTSNFVVADIDTGDTLSELMYIPMGGTLLPTDVPGLED